jgi:hypothetical protein
MLALLGAVALVALLSALWALDRVLRSLPRRNDDFGLE